MLNLLSAVVTILVLLGMGCWMLLWTEKFISLSVRLGKKEYQRYKHIPLVGKLFSLDVQMKESKFYFWFIKVFGAIYTLALLYIMFIVIRRLF